MKILIKCADNPTIYYHYDNRKLEVGDIIQGNEHNDIPIDIFKTYSFANEELVDMSKVVYCLDHMDTDYDDIYEHCYIIESDKIFMRMMDYSIIVCSKDIDNILKNSGFDPKDNQVRKPFISFMSNAYLGNRECMELLRDKHDYDISDKVEYICDNAKIIGIIK